MNTEKIIQEILQKKAITAGLTGQQQSRIIDYLNTDMGLSYQQLSKFVAPRINAKELDVYYFLLTYDKHIYNDNNLNKIQ